MIACAPVHIHMSLNVIAIETKQIKENITEKIEEENQPKAMDRMKNDQVAFIVATCGTFFLLHVW